MKLTNDQITHIFCEALLREASKKPEEQNHFLSAYADAVRMSDPKDFLILRPVSLILIAKYKLGNEPELVVHNFPQRKRA